MKIFSFASAIEEGKYNGNEKYKSGSIPVADVVINDSNRKGWGNITFDTGFAYSSNVAASILALRVGVEKLSYYYDSLGFGHKTNIELASEAVGDAEFVYQSELATASFGQGVSVTPIQMLQALSSIVNDGTTLKPYIVSKVVDSDGETIYTGGKEEVKKVFSSETVKQVQGLMHKMVYDGLSKYWQPSNVTLIGKTGTAQIAGKNGGYLDGLYDVVKSFAGIFPEENPRYILYIATRHFEGTSRNFADISRTTVEEIASYAKLNDVTSDVDKSKIINVSNYISKTKEDVIKEIDNKKINIIVLGDGKYIINQYPEKGGIVLAGGKLFLVTNSKNIKMPDITGWSLNEVKIFAKLTNLELNYSGYGYVKTQSIEKDEIINTDTLTIELENTI